MLSFANLQDLAKGAAVIFVDLQNLAKGAVLNFVNLQDLAKRAVLNLIFVNLQNLCWGEGDAEGAVVNA